MNGRSAAIGSAAPIAAMVLAALWALTILPAQTPVPVHFGWNGAPDGWARPGIALFLLPAAAALIWLLMALAPRITRYGGNLRRSPVAYGTAWLAATALLAAVQGRVIAVALGHAGSGAGFMALLLGGFFIIVGNVLGKLRRNMIIGIRTPWTLADERVWDKTHRFGGWLFVIGGFGLAASAFTRPAGSMTPMITIGVLLAIAVAVTVKSWLLWREERRRDGMRH